MLFQLPNRVVCPSDDEVFTKLVYNSSFDLTHALLLFMWSQEVNWFTSSGVKWFSCSFAEGAVALLQSFTVLGQKRDTDGELLPSEALPEVFVTWLSEKLFCHCNAQSAVPHHHGGVPSPQPSGSDVLAASP